MKRSIGKELSKQQLILTSKARSACFYLLAVATLFLSLATAFVMSAITKDIVIADITGTLGLFVSFVLFGCGDYISKNNLEVYSDDAEFNVDFTNNNANIINQNLTLALTNTSKQKDTSARESHYLDDMELAHKYCEQIKTTLKTRNNTSFKTIGKMIQDLILHAEQSVENKKYLRDFFIQTLPSIAEFIEQRQALSPNLNQQEIIESNEKMQDIIEHLKGEIEGLMQKNVQTLKEKASNLDYMLSMRKATTVCVENKYLDA